MNIRRAVLVGGVILAALIIGFFLQDVVEQVVVRPIVYFLWSLRVFYQYIPQPFLWAGLLLVLLYLVLGTLTARLDLPRFRRNKQRPVLGPLEELASQIEHKDEGVYYKWKLARILGEIALEMQELRKHQRQKKLDFSGSKVNGDVKEYLEAGLYKNFADYPLSGSLPTPGNWSRLPATPFGINLDPVLDYLESQMESDNDRKRS